MHVTADKKALYIEIDDGKTDHANSLLSDCYFQSLKDVYTFKYINAAAWLMTRQTLETLGGFDPIFFLYGEDDNYLQRMEYHGVKLGLAPKIQITHDHQENTGQMSEKYKQYRAEQCRIVEYVNILHRFSIFKYQVYLLRKIFSSICQIDRRKAMLFKNELNLFIKYKTQIKISRNINILKGRNWL